MCKWRIGFCLASSLGLDIARGRCVSRHVVVRLGYVTEMH